MKIVVYCWHYVHVRHLVLIWQLPMLNYALDFTTELMLYNIFKSNTNLTYI